MNRQDFSPYLFGIFVAYVALAIFQATTESILHPKIFLTSSVVSMIISCVELAKLLCTECTNSKDFITSFSEKLNSNKEKLFDPFNALNLKEKKMMKKYFKDKKIVNIIFFDRIASIFLNKIFPIFIFIGYTSAIFFLIIIPFINLTNFNTTKVINITTLFAFAFMFLTLNINTMIQNNRLIRIEVQEKLDKEIAYIDKIYELTGIIEELKAK